MILNSTQPEIDNKSDTNGDRQITSNMDIKNSRPIYSKESTSAYDSYNAVDTSTPNTDAHSDLEETYISNLPHIISDNTDHLEPSKNELIVRNLLITSDFFLNKAHQSVLKCNNALGCNDYFKMIKISIKCLLMLVKKYELCLSPYFESIVCFKLAKIYFRETDNMNRADHYVNMAISIAGRNKLYEIKFISEFLAAQIIEKTNTKLSLNYLNDKIDFYRKLELNYFSNLFKILKVNNLLLMDADTGLVVLQNLCFDAEMDPLTRSLCLIYQGGLHSYRGSPSQTLTLLNEAESLLTSYGQDYPVQLKLMLNLSRYFASLQMNQLSVSKEYMHVLSNLIQSEQKLDWASWKEDGSFVIDICLDDLNVTKSISYQVNWLNSDEFVIMFYFITGISLLHEANNGKNKAKKVFDKCIQIISKQLDELTFKVESRRTFPLNQLTNKIIMLNYIKYNINYYQVWMKFIGHDYSDISHLNEFMNKYNSGKFTSEEFAYYKLLIPRVFYLFGIYYHHQGDTHAAKFYFMKVRNYSVNPKKSADKIVPILQFSLGIGCELFQPENKFSELFVLSSLHLLILIEHELKQLSTYRTSNEDINDHHKLSTILYQELGEIFLHRENQNSNSFKNSFIYSNGLLLLSYDLLMCIYNGSDKATFDILVKHMDTFESITYFPFARLLLNYVLFKNTMSLVDREKYFATCLNLLSDSKSRSERLLSVFILEESRRRCIENGDNEQVNVINLRIKGIQDELNDKFRLALYKK